MSDSLVLILFPWRFGISSDPLTWILFPWRLALIGIMWAPFAAIITVLIARQRRVVEPFGFPSCFAYAFAGCVYAALFFIPWIFLVAWLLGRPFPSWMIRLGYLILYAGTLIGPIGLTVLFGVSGVVIAVSGLNGETVQGVEASSAVIWGTMMAGLSAVIVAAGICLLLWSVRVLQHRYAAVQTISHRSALPSYMYLGVVAWIVAVYVGAIVGLLTVFAIGYIIE